jgi:phosphate transport system ATP-binding protein
MGNSSISTIPVLVPPPNTSGDRKTPDPPETRIEVSNLQFYYGSRQVLHNIDLQIPSSRITALIGPSGCGKSTFLRTLNRMHEAIRHARAVGTVLLDNQDLLRMDVTELRRKVGMVFQKSNPFPKSIFENVAYGPRLNRGGGRLRLEEAVEASLRRAALWEEVKDHLQKPAGALSGGQQQRLCIARALAVEPEVLLLDEPCSALDPVTTVKIEELLFELKKTCTIVIVTHNMQQAARVGDYTGFLLLGKLIEFGESATIFQKPSRKETEDYITGRFG